MSNRDSKASHCNVRAKSKAARARHHGARGLPRRRRRQRWRACRGVRGAQRRAARVCVCAIGSWRHRMKGCEDSRMQRVRAVAVEAAARSTVASAPSRRGRRHGHRSGRRPRSRGARGRPSWEALLPLSARARSETAAIKGLSWFRGIHSSEPRSSPVVPHPCGSVGRVCANKTSFKLADLPDSSPRPLGGRAPTSGVASIDGSRARAHYRQHMHA